MKKHLLLSWRIEHWIFEIITVTVHFTVGYNIFELKILLSFTCCYSCFLIYEHDKNIIYSYSFYILYFLGGTMECTVY